MGRPRTAGLLRDNPRHWEDKIIGLLVRNKRAESIRLARLGTGKDWALVKAARDRLLANGEIIMIKEGRAKFYALNKNDSAKVVPFKVMSQQEAINEAGGNGHAFKELTSIVHQSAEDMATLREENARLRGWKEGVQEAMELLKGKVNG